MQLFKRHGKDYAIDSLNVLTPADLFLVNPFVDFAVTISEESGEIIDRKARSFMYDEQGIKIRAGQVSLFGKDYVSIGFNSKMLQRQYFEGLHVGNFRKAFDFAKNAFSFDIDYYIFIQNSICYDVDFKFDFISGSVDFSDFCVSHKGLPTVRLFRGSASNPFDKGVYTGVQFVNRADANLSKPFVKIYSKAIELDNRSTLFRGNFLPYVDGNLRRFECTIRNRAHFAKFGIVNNLESLLLLNPSFILSICQSAYLAHVGDKIARNTTNSEAHAFSLNDWCLCYLLGVALSKDGASMETILNEVLDSFPSITPPSKSRKKKAITKQFKHFLELQRLFDLENFRVTPKDAFFIQDNNESTGQ